MRQSPAPPPSAPRTVIVQVPTPAPVAQSPVAATVFRVPQTAEEMRILIAQRKILSDQIQNVRDQRRSVARAYEQASGASRAGLEQQLQSLDGRLLQLQADLDASGRALYQSPVSATTTSVGFPAQFPNLNSGQLTAISIVFTVVCLGPLAMSLGRLLWRRSGRPAVPPGWNDAAQRLERLEQAVDTVAVEVERVSEGQRFMTRLMTQAPGTAASNGAEAQAINGGQPLPALGAGSPEPVVFQKEREEVRVRRS